MFFSWGKLLLKTWISVADIALNAARSAAFAVTAKAMPDCSACARVRALPLIPGNWPPLSRTALWNRPLANRDTISCRADMSGVAGIVSKGGDCGLSTLYRLKAEAAVRLRPAESGRYVRPVLAGTVRSQLRQESALQKSARRTAVSNTQGLLDAVLGLAAAFVLLGEDAGTTS